MGFNRAPQAPAGLRPDTEDTPHTIFLFYQQILTFYPLTMLHNTGSLCDNFIKLFHDHQKTFLTSSSNFLDNFVKLSRDHQQHHLDIIIKLSRQHLDIISTSSSNFLDIINKLFHDHHQTFLTSSRDHLDIMKKFMDVCVLNIYFFIRYID